jgi:dipeptidyl-peptidase-4
VRIGVVDVATRRTTWIDLGADSDVYVAAMDFADSPAEVWLTRLNRHQNRLDVLLADAGTGGSRVIMTDTDSAWVEYAHKPLWFDGGKQFLFESERDGYAHVYLYTRAGSLVRRVTPGDWDVVSVQGVDEKARVVYFTATMDGPLTRPLLRIGLDGRGLARISTEPGTHSVEFDPSHRWYVDTYSHAGVPPIQVLRRTDGTTVRTVADNHVLAGKIAALALMPPEFLKVRISDGTLLNASIIKPRDFDPAKRYPLLMWVYGGPGSQTVMDAWGGAYYLWFQKLARDGYLVASVDNRGTGARGSRFKHMAYLHLGRYETADQIAAARYFGGLPYVDPTRIGIWGWSYGAYVASRTLFVGGNVFKAAIAVAPVADWRLYDTIYTERYMLTPAENPDGYDEGSSMAYVDSLKGRLLLVHGTGDDNVHFQNTLRMIQRLERANKQFDMRIYPNKTHSISGGNTSENVFGLLTDWLQKNL